jgi:excisionase family DNA binding protein
MLPRHPPAQLRCGGLSFGGHMEANSFLTIQQAADALSVSRPTIHALVDEGALPAFKITRRLMKIRRDDLEAFIARSRVPNEIDHAA